MKQIIENKKIEKLIKQIGNKKIVLAGGCFDIVHLGHIKFLEKAKKTGEILIIMLESDENIKKIKGQKRPINNQKNRAEFLIKLKMVDWIIKLPEMTKDEDYWEIVKKIKPQIIAVSEGDKNIEKKKKQAKEIGAKLMKVTNLVKQQSTTKIIEVISESF
jgi:rfaE bifunctional protein nucleotidyltransferase chain/domain